MEKRLSQATLDFISDLQQNNERDWFQKNKGRYEEAKQDYMQFVDTLLKGVAGFDEVAQNVTAKDTMYRIYRDVRFSNDKRPYKDHFCSFVAEGGKKSVNPGYYLYINPNNNSSINCGLWMPPSPALKAVRQELDYNLEQFESIINNPEFKKYYTQVSGETLKTNPKGYDSENPAIKYLRHKTWNASHPLPDKLLTSDALYDTCLGAIKAAKPFVDFFLHPMLELEAPKEV